MNPRHNVYALLVAFGFIALAATIAIILWATSESTVILSGGIGQWK